MHRWPQDKLIQRLHDNEKKIREYLYSVETLLDEIKHITEELTKRESEK